jgi:hypothetical protein
MVGKRLRTPDLLPRPSRQCDSRALRAARASMVRTLQTVWTRMHLRISAIVDAHFGLIVDDQSASSRVRREARKHWCRM